MDCLHLSVIENRCIENLVFPLLSNVSFFLLNVPPTQVRVFR